MKILKIRKCLSFALIAAMLASLTACADVGEAKQDTSPITMCIAMGNGESYYKPLAEGIQKDLGIDVELVYMQNCDTTDMLRLAFDNNDMPADIVFTASKTNDELLKDSCVDLMSKSSIASKFKTTTVDECMTEDGAIYQLPVSSKLIGITYNETLLNEMGYELPKTFEDMVALKAKCDADGVKFAVSDGAATGHGFNWLFHLMGSKWLSTPDGTAWLDGFLKGDESVDAFKKECDYFKKWTEAGLWGSFRTADWNGNTEFMQTRALFWYGITNSVTEYEGPEYDEEGKETGRFLNDTYKTMPWISEDGSNNCYTYYDNCWVYVNKNLEESYEAEKLSKVFEILDYIVSENGARLVNECGRDTYISVNNYIMGDDRLYSGYSEEINTGFIQPWYYNYFNQDTIVYTGEVINKYIAGSGSFDDIFTTLNEYNEKHLNSEIEVLADFPDGLNREETAKLAALVAAKAIDKTLEENGREERVEVTIVPYASELSALQPFRSVSVSNSIVYKGPLDGSMSLTILPPNALTPTAIYMTGAEIKAITEKGFDPSDWFIDAAKGESTFDSKSYGPYPYVCLTKDNAELADDKEYLVALYEKYITKAEFDAFKEAGKVVDDLENVHSMNDGINLFTKEHPEITADTLTL